MTEGNANDPCAAYRVDFASVLDHDALVDLCGDETDFPGFEAARDITVDVLEGVLDQLTHLVSQVRKADRFEDLDLGWWEPLITKIDRPE